MAANTINMKEFEEKSGNIFKGLLVISKRSRQINELYKADEVQEYEDVNEEEVIEVVPDEDYVPLPKPVVVAMEEFLEEKIKILDKEF